jgi:hypothetical protein
MYGTGTIHSRLLCKRCAVREDLSLVDQITASGVQVEAGLTQSQLPICTYRDLPLAKTKMCRQLFVLRHAGEEQSK